MFSCSCSVYSHPRDFVGKLRCLEGTGKGFGERYELSAGSWGGAEPRPQTEFGEI